MKGKVYIASMNMRGKWAESPPGAIRLNVTSAQSKENKNRLAFSPMTPVDGGYEGFWNFESYWQSGKVFEGIPHEKSVEWWKKQDTPKRRYPNSKGLKCMYACWENYEDEKMDYVTSRKKVYVPQYYNLINKRGADIILEWKNKIESGVDVVVYDFDGPRNESGEPICREVSIEFLREKINNTTYPFGHGYVVAGLLKGIQIEEII